MGKVLVYRRRTYCANQAKNREVRNRQHSSPSRGPWAVALALACPVPVPASPRRLLWVFPRCTAPQERASPSCNDGVGLAPCYPRPQLRVVIRRTSSRTRELETLLVTKATLAPLELRQAGKGPLGDRSPTGGRETPTFTHE